MNNPSIKCYYPAPYTPTDAEMLAARLARMKHLIEALEVMSSQSAERDLFLKLKLEMDATRLALKLPDSECRSARTLRSIGAGPTARLEPR